jgi:hypothetical protein
MLETYYQIHGLGVRLIIDGPAIAAAAQTLLRRFPRQQSGGTAALEIRFRAVRDRSEIPYRVSPGAEVLFSGKAPSEGDRLRAEWQCTVTAEGERNVADFHEQGCLIVDGPRGLAEGYLIEPEAMHLDIRMSFLHFALVELLKQHGLYTIHAAAMEKGGRGVLISGASGRGKTTCCVSLLRAGYRCLSDDHPLLRETESGFEVLSFPVKIDVTEQTVQFFEELRQANGKLHSGVRKQYFYVEELFSDAEADSCHPAAILFPRVVDAPTSRLEPLPKGRALEELMRQGMLVLDREVARRQFHSFSRLIAQTPCYRLHFGEDFLALPDLVGRLLDEGAGDGADRRAPALS